MPSRDDPYIIPVFIFTPIFIITVTLASGSVEKALKRLCFRNPRLSERRSHRRRPRAVSGAPAMYHKAMSRRDLLTYQTVNQHLRCRHLRCGAYPQAPLDLRFRLGTRSAWGSENQSSPSFCRHGRVAVECLSGGCGCFRKYPYQKKY